MDEPHEFDCQSCGEHIISFVTHANDNPKCLTCAWIDTLPNESDRQAMRRYFKIKEKSDVQKDQEPLV